ncbi:MAG: hypothetical protein Q8861_02180 [Bacteroidota bacterium]|nr:hypothetical protein [Bacteroidota bacterium]
MAKKEYTLKEAYGWVPAVKQKEVFDELMSIMGIARKNVYERINNPAYVPTIIEAPGIEMIFAKYDIKIKWPTKSKK